MIPGFEELKEVGHKHNEQHRIALHQAWPIIQQVATTAPTTDLLKVGWAQLYDDGTNRRIYVNLNDTLYYWALTAA